MCGQRCSNPLVGACHPLISLSFSLCLFVLFIHPPLFNPSQSNPRYPQSHPLLSSLTHFLLSKEEELDYLTPPVWASHLPIFLPVDHQPAGVVMEGEIHRSTSSPPSGFPPPPPPVMHGAALCEPEDWMSISVNSSLLSVVRHPETPQERLFRRSASMNAKHVMVFTTPPLPLFLSTLGTRQPSQSSLHCLLRPSCFLSSFFFEHLKKK